ncbi:MAG TPA: phosphatase PAP2 family protein [Rhizomicrobium sp.]|nr:phosphatase PAP2 family protein [Rhizomicrobium sp.]
MLFWAGIVLILLGVASIGFDRRSSHWLYDAVDRRFWRFLDRTTHLAKASHWLIAAALLYAFTRSAYALAFIVSLVAGSVALHAIKLVAGRRRPRDDLEMGRYGFELLAFDTRYNSFPSGHALTIFCVAAIASCALPSLAALWFAVAAWLALTRALLTAHYLSDVLAGAGIGLISAHETVIHWFPQLAPIWF